MTKPAATTTVAAGFSLCRPELPGCAFDHLMRVVHACPGNARLLHCEDRSVPIPRTENAGPLNARREQESCRCPEKRPLPALSPGSPRCAPTAPATCARTSL